VHVRTRALLSVLLALGVALTGSTSAGAGSNATVTPTRIIKTLNEQRKANGIPGGIKVNASWSQKCKKHDLYMDRNRELTHYEEKGKPGYTEGGAWAGKHSVISFGSTWADGNVFEEAPIHLAQLLQPKFDVSGAWELPGTNGRWGCVITLAGYKRAEPPTDRVYSYPGDRTTGVATDYDASEGPFTPNQIVGAPAHCGQELFVFASGPSLKNGNPYLYKITHATLAPEGGGHVKIKIVDGETKIPDKYGGGEIGYYLGPGAGIIIPMNPLEKSTVYEASVTIEGGETTFDYSWSFTTES
jgi:hypothetical protein